MKLKYTVDEGSDEPIMLINKHIGMDDEEGEGIMGDQFQNELMYLDTLGKKRIKVFVCSPGGNVMDGMQMYNAILSTKTKVDTYNVGVAASIAGVICQAGRTRYMSDYALLMMHNPFDPSKNSVTPELEAFKNSIVKMLARKNPTMTEEGISDLMNNTTWLQAEGKDGAKALGFCDVVENSNDMNKPRAINVKDPALDAKATWKQYANYFNSINTKQKPSTMKNVFNKLKITDNSTEDVIIAAIEGIENRATTAEAEKVKVDGELVTAKAEVTELKNKLKTAEEKVTAAELKDSTATATALENAATLAVENLAKIGKIKNDVDTIKNVKAQFIKDFDGSKALYEAVPLNKKGANIVDSIEKADETPKYTMGAQMILIANKTAVK